MLHQKSMCFENNPPTEAVAAAAASEGAKPLVSQQSRGVKQHCRQVLGKNKGTLPAHIKNLFDDAEQKAGSKIKAQNELIDHLCEKNKRGKWEMVLNAPFF